MAFGSRLSEINYSVNLMTKMLTVVVVVVVVVVMVVVVVDLVVDCYSVFVGWMWIDPLLVHYDVVWPSCAE